MSDVSFDTTDPVCKLNLVKFPFCGKFQFKEKIILKSVLSLFWTSYFTKTDY